MSTRTITLSDQLYQYMLTMSPPEHEALVECRRITAKMPTGEMQISPELGHFMGFLIKLINAKRTLDIGVFTGYSSTAVALALPEDGQVIACDRNSEWSEIAKKTWESAGVYAKVALKLGPAVEALQALILDEQGGSFDFAFIDANKKDYDTYYEQCLELVRPGGVIILDNMFFRGEVVEPESDNAKVLSQLNEKIKNDARVESCLLPIGDGIQLVRVKA